MFAALSGTYVNPYTEIVDVESQTELKRRIISEEFSVKNHNFTILFKRFILQPFRVGR
jgi:hypothetical protein